jgi:hypothetical protein
MFKSSLFIVTMLSFFLIGLSSSAFAARGLGVGVNGMIDSRDFANSVPALSVLYEMDKIRFGGLFGFNIITKGQPKIFKFGGQFFYKLHGNQTADFSLGGLLGMRIIADYPVDQTDVGLLLGLGAQVRAFIVTNVSLDASLGLGLLVDLNDKSQTAVALSGDVMATIGLTYYFY